MFLFEIQGVPILSIVVPSLGLTIFILRSLKGRAGHVFSVSDGAWFQSVEAVENFGWVSYWVYSLENCKVMSMLFR